MVLPSTEWAVRAARLHRVELRSWRSDEHPELPDPNDFVDPAWDRTEHLLVAQYFRLGTLARAYMGVSPCRICGALNGSSEYTDGRFLWPEGLAHYIEEHNVRLPHEVIHWSQERMEAIDQSEADLQWWLQATS